MVRLLSGLALAAATLAAILLLPALGLRIVAVLVAVVATHEYLGIARASGSNPSPWLAYVFVAAVCWLVSRPTPAADVILGSALAVLVVDVLFRARSMGDAGAGVSAGIYIGLGFGALGAVHVLGGRFAVLLLVATIVVSDTAQYYSGRLFGRHLLAPRISPKKTIEGALGGLVFGTALMMLAGRRVFPAAAPTTLALVGLTVVVLGICGDLFESRLKRAAGLKDSSRLIPGHGGILDRVDALLLAAPAFSLLLRLLL